MTAMNPLHFMRGSNMLNPMRTRAAAAAAMATLMLALSAPAFAQRAYPSPEAASEAFFRALADNDHKALQTVLGNDWRRFVPAGEVDREDIYDFLGAYAKEHKVVPDGPDRALLGAGDSGWTLPIPIVKGAGGWHFDPRAGADQMQTRRIGRNELAAMRAALAYFDAQREYAQVDRDGNGVLEFAQKFASTPGKHDGLYWHTGPGEAESPLGPLYAPARAGEGYHGYHFKILKALGPYAPGGAYD
jgi:hypothetical protein